ncbi:LysR family transcriptional regulator [Hoeflea sp. TYP-13]|uniref:LysR family transcriptional regulator n=1 Tax=Hoeflea sp. TYP-13 TaxID=3230023 RepID=UPI0034C5FA5D
MKLIQLKYFASIVENGGFIAASKDLSVAQPALSRQIVELEAEIGVDLLNRGPGGTTVTGAGLRFYHHTRSILEKVEIARTDARRSSGDLVGKICIAIPVGIAGFLASEIVQKVEQLYPDITVTIEDGLGFQTGQAIDAGKVDFGIIPNVGRLQNVTLQPILQESIFLFSKRQGAAPDTADIPLIELENMKLIMPNRKVHVRRSLEEAFMQTGRNLEISYEQQSLLTIRSMVRAGVGSTVLNWPAMADVWETGDVDARRIVNPTLSRIVSLAVPTTRPLTSASRAVYEIVQQVLIDEVSNGNWKGQLVVEE